MEKAIKNSVKIEENKEAEEEPTLGNIQNAGGKRKRKGGKGGNANVVE